MATALAAAGAGGTAGGAHHRRHHRHCHADGAVVDGGRGGRLRAVDVVHRHRAAFGYKTSMVAIYTK